MKKLICVFLFVILAMSVFSQTIIEKLNWIEGNWTTEKWGGTVEEYWSAPSGNSIIGMFRFIVDGKLRFSEHFTITEIDENLTLRLRHFDANFISWEEKEEYLEFRFVEMEDSSITFNGIRYELLDSGELKVNLELKRDDKTEIEEFIFSKM